MQAFEPKKLAELIIYFTKHSQDDLLFGSTKLNKLLWVADFLAYGYMGRSLTGATYIHQEQGPTPSPDQFIGVRDALVKSGRLRVEEEETYRGTKKRPVTESEPDMSLFNDAEVDLCRDVLEELTRMSNREVSEWSHKFPGWLYTRQGEEIPYQTVYLWEQYPATKEDLAWGLRVAKELGVA
jgi:hypothetical protein